MPIKNRGFTLIEVLVAMAVATIGALGGAALLALGMARTAEARRVSAANHLANQVIERLRLEVRFDLEADKGSGSVGGKDFTAEDAWRAERLPYSSKDSVEPSGSGLPSCNPPGAEDNPAVDYNVGPLPFVFEGHRYLVCYQIEAPNSANCLPDAACARVKVIWAESGGYGAHRTLAYLTSGR